MKHESDEQRKPSDGIGNRINDGCQGVKLKMTREQRACGQLKPALVKLVA